MYDTPTSNQKYALHNVILFFLKMALNVEKLFVFRKHNLHV